MRTNVTFRHPAEFVPVSDEDGILAVCGAQWFVSILRRIPELQVESELCQEDWGVVVFAQLHGKRFWVGLSMWPDGEHAWLAHFHHGSFAWFQRLSLSGKTAFQRFIAGAHDVLRSEPMASDIVWYEESQMRKADPDGFPTPTEG